MERKLAVVLYADVAGYSRLTGEDEEGTHCTLSAYLDAITAAIERQGGTVVHFAGDAVLAEFPSVVPALSCAVEVQRDLESRNESQPDDRKVQFRIGINLGDVIVDRNDIYGDGVNVAARLESLADAGGICISEAVRDAIGNKLPLGYEFMGEQSVKNIAKPVRSYRVLLDTRAAPPAARRSPNRLIMAVAAVVLLGAGTAIFWSLVGRDPDPVAAEAVPALELPAKPSIAVLPFNNLSGDPDQEYFSDGITEDIITNLSRFPDLFVIARNSMFSYKGKPVKVQQVARELGVRYVLEGSVQKAGSAVRITAQLVDASKGHHLWAERYDRELKDIFAVRDEVTQAITATLMGDSGKLMKTERERAFAKDTDNLDAYDYVLRGQAHVYRTTKVANDQAKEMFEKAVVLDPSYARAHSALAWTYLNDWRHGWSENREQSLERAFELAQKAVAVDDSDPNAHAALADVYLWQKQHQRAIAELDLAVTLNPNDADLYAGLGEVLTWAGKPEEAVEQVEKAMRLNPNYPFYYLWSLGHAYFLMGKYEEAIASLKSLGDRNPNFAPARIYLCTSYAQLGRMGEAETERAELVKSNPAWEDLSNARMREFLPYKNPADLAHVLGAMRKAGLME